MRMWYSIPMCNLPEHKQEFLMAQQRHLALAWEVGQVGFGRVATGAISLEGHSLESMRMDTGTASGAPQLQLLIANNKPMALNVAANSTLTGNVTTGGYVNVGTSLQVSTGQPQFTVNVTGFVASYSQGAQMQPVAERGFGSKLWSVSAPILCSCGRSVYGSWSRCVSTIS